MHQELHQFVRNDVWELVPRPQDTHVIGTKWIFKNKTNEDGEVVRNTDPSPFYQGLVRVQALQVRCTSREASIKCLKEHLGSKADALKKFKKSSQTLSQEVVDLKVKLNGMAQQTDDLMKENANLKFEVVALHEHMEKVKEKAIEEY